jgi:hypothetical protein
MKRLLTLGVAVACVGTFAAMGMAGTSAEAPRNTTPPAVSGSTVVGAVLNATTGTWTADPAPTYTYRWLRCNRAGTGCFVIPNATRETYTVRLADVGNRLRAAVTARNASGAATVRSAATPIVTRTGDTTPPGGTVSIQSVNAPQRLVIDRVQFSPAVVTSRATPITMRVHVSDTRGRSVNGALVYVRSTPIVTRTPPEMATGSDGWVTFSTQPEADFPIRRGYAVQFFARARKPGDNVLAGVSTRRLVQVTTAPAS